MPLVAVLLGTLGGLCFPSACSPPISYVVRAWPFGWFSKHEGRAAGQLNLAKPSIFPEVVCFVGASGILDLECRDMTVSTGRLPCMDLAGVGDEQ